MLAPKLTCSIVELADNGTLVLAFNEPMDFYTGNLAELNTTFSIKIIGMQDTYNETWEVLKRT